MSVVYNALRYTEQGLAGSSKCYFRSQVQSIYLFIYLFTFVSLYFIINLINFTRLNWLTTLHKFQEYDSIIHLYITLCVYHSESSLLPSPYLILYSLPPAPTFLPSGNHLLFMFINTNHLLFHLFVAFFISHI